MKRTQKQNINKNREREKGKTKKIDVQVRGEECRAAKTNKNWGGGGEETI
jgi:hypothetical protein